jgi:hypothetical protein
VAPRDIFAKALQINPTDTFGRYNLDLALRTKG